MTTFVVEALIDLLDRSFDGDDESSVMSNVRHVTGEEWDRLAPGCERTIRQIFEHAAIAKHAYAEHLFGPARRRYMDVFKDSPLRSSPEDSDAVVAWAREGHAGFIAGMRVLTDDGLAAMTTTHWGKVAPKRWVIGVMIQHDCYHAGEINHLRALLQRNDDWWPEFRDA